MVREGWPGLITSLIVGCGLWHLNAVYSSRPKKGMRKAENLLDARKTKPWCGQEGRHSAIFGAVWAWWFICRNFITKQGNITNTWMKPFSKHITAFVSLLFNSCYMELTVTNTFLSAMNDSYYFMKKEKFSIGSLKKWRDLICLGPFNILGLLLWPS